MATKIWGTERGLSVRRTVAWLAVALTLTLSLMGATAGDAGATTKVLGHVSMSKAEYMRLCSGLGGIATDNGESVTCRFPGGEYSVCNFYTMVCVDVFRSQPIVPAVPVDGVVVAQTDTNGTGPTTTTTTTGVQTSRTTAVATTADDEP